MKDRTFEISKLVGKNIKAFRVKKDLTQSQLAERALMSANMIGHIERGEKSPTVETLAGIANALNIDLYKLFIFED
ncbi:TPA: helix-turn-helix transcriptional regulator [Candidatus Scatousia excrementigallinarum]|uniref:Helix-turn-helix transcriptional regulator n=1 Tax=Candidatus Scatousia excrementigallinarum TaxID=2840935 RepID=A0A9D1JPF0_9BACT|nr:helix-turn-helix transcriptional regulator [Candidatus Scatousia excrementigallinarum]